MTVFVREEILFFKFECSMSSTIYLIGIFMPFFFEYHNAILWQNAI